VVLIGRGCFISQFYADIGLCPMDVYGMYRAGMSTEDTATKMFDDGWFGEPGEMSSGDRPAVPPKQ
jgi:hypothetical protein